MRQCVATSVLKVAVTRKLQKSSQKPHVVCSTKLYISNPVYAVFLSHIVEQVLHYHHSKFHSDTTFIRKDIAPNKYDI